MTMFFKSLNGLDTIDASGLSNDQRITLVSATGLTNVTWGTLVAVISDPLTQRLENLENLISGPEGANGPSIWPTPRTISLTGLVTGSVTIDGSQNASLLTSIADGALSVSKVNGLATQLDALGIATNNRWGTGYTIGPNPTTFGGDLNQLSGAVYLYTQAGTTNAPLTTGNPFTILQNGPQNYGQQIALRSGEAWIRGQVVGAWGGWNKLWTSANLNPTDLLLKTDVATSASKLASIRSFSLTGLVTASGVSFDGTQNVALNTSIADGGLSISKTSGLQTALDSRLKFQGVVPISQTLNTLLQSGIYTQNVDTEVTLAHNYPIVGTLGVLRVMSQDGYVVQEYITQSNVQYRRFYDGVGWTSWNKTWSSVDFDPTSKYDKTGGQINGNVSVSGTLSSQLAVSGLTFNSLGIPTLGAPAWMLQTSAVTQRLKGIRSSLDYVSLVSLDTSGGTAHNELKVYDDGRLQLNDHSIFHAGIFDPSNPVPSGGLLNIGDPSDANLQLRSDGRYSIDGGVSWREFNEIPQDITDPTFNSLAIGPDSDIRFSEDLSSGTLVLRTGSAVDYKTFVFHSNGNFLVPNGRVLISGNEAWHAGNFDPALKLNATATAVAAVKLSTARSINGVLFDGTSDITITSPSVIPDSPTITGVTVFDVNNGSSGKLRITSNGATGINIDALDDALAANVGLNFRASTLSLSGNSIYHSGNFDPSSKLNVSNPVVDGKIQIKNADNQWALESATAAGATRGGIYNRAGGISLVKSSGNWRELSIDSSDNLTYGDATTQNIVWHAGNFDPNSRQLARSEISDTAATITDWNNAVNNGWYMGSNAANAPESSVWFMGKVTRHNALWVQQELVNFTSGVSGKKWRRWLLNGTWSSWSQDELFGGVVGAQRLWAGWDSGNNGSISCSNWFRTTGQTGIYFSDYGGGMYMTDSNLVRSYNSKGLGGGWFENTNVNLTPHTSAATAAFRANGTYGGGYGLIEGSNQISLYSVSGDLNFGFGTNSVTSRASLDKTGVFHAADYALTSDSRYKTSIQPLTFAGRLEPKSFVWKESGKPDFGFIAQDVQRLYPEAVVVDSVTGKLSLTQGKLTAVLAVQANQNSDEIEKLQKQLKDLSDQIADIRRLSSSSV